MLYDAIQFEKYLKTFRKKCLSPSSGQKIGADGVDGRMGVDLYFEALLPKLYGVKSQKTIIFTVTAAETSDLTDIPTFRQRYTYFVIDEHILCWLWIEFGTILAVCLRKTKNKDCHSDRQTSPLSLHMTKNTINFTYIS